MGTNPLDHFCRRDGVENNRVKTLEPWVTYTKLRASHDASTHASGESRRNPLGMSTSLTALGDPQVGHL
jgi:hypothetical protein